MCHKLGGLPICKGLQWEAGMKRGSEYCWKHKELYVKRSDAKLLHSSTLAQAS